MALVTISAGVRRRALILLFLVSLLNYLDRNLLGILLPSIKAELQLSDTQLGFITGIAFSIFYSTMGIPIARLADRLQRRRVIAAAMTIWSAMTAACGLAQNFWQLAIARILVGVGEAGATPPSHSLIADIFPKTERARALSVYAIGSSAGLILSYLAAGWITQMLGWRAALSTFGIAGIVVAVAVLLYMPNPARGQSDGHDPPAEPPPLREVLAVILRKPTFIHNCIASGLFAMLWFGLLNWLPSYFGRTFHLPINQIGNWLSLVVGVSTLLGTYAGGVVGDRLARTDVRWLMWLSALGTALATPFYIFAFTRSDPMIAFATLCLPFFLGVMQSGPQHATTQGISPPAMRATASACYLLAVGLIGGLGAQAIGLLSDLMRPELGDAALGRALVVVTVVASLWSALHFWLAARTLANDFVRSGPDSGGERQLG